MLSEQTWIHLHNKFTMFGLSSTGFALEKLKMAIRTHLFDHFVELEDPQFPSPPAHFIQAKIVSPNLPKLYMFLVYLMYIQQTDHFLNFPK